jgi:hypothetical protein
VLDRGTGDHQVEVALLWTISFELRALSSVAANYGDPERKQRKSLAHSLDAFDVLFLPRRLLGTEEQLSNHKQRDADVARLDVGQMAEDGLVALQQSSDDVSVEDVEMRVVGWLRRHGFLDNDPDEPPTEPVARSALDACLEGSLGLGELTVLPSRRCPIDDGHEALPAPPRSQRRGGHVRGFDVHAGVVVSASDREARERLLRYCARPRSASSA